LSDTTANPQKLIIERIKERESSNIERKSSFRYDIKIGNPNPKVLVTMNAIQYWKAILRTIFRLNTHPWSWIVIVCFLIFIWHIPQIFDYTSTHENVHVMQHISFIMVGAGVFMTIRLLGESFNLFLIFSLIGMMGFSGLILVISDSQIYQVYSISSRHNAGIYMVITFVILLLVIMPAYLIRRTMFHINTSTSGGDTWCASKLVRKLYVQVVQSRPRVWQKLT